MAGDEPDDGFGESNQDVQREHHENKTYTSVENTRSAFICRRMRRWYRIWRADALRCQNCVQVRLSAIQPMSHLDVVITTNIKEHESASARAVHRQVNNNFGCICVGWKLKSSDALVRKTVAFSIESFRLFSNLPTKRFHEVLTGSLSHQILRRFECSFLVKVFVLPVHFQFSQIIKTAKALKIT